MKLTTKQLRQMIKEELQKFQILENEEEYKDFHTTAGRDMGRTEALKKAAKMIASGPDEAVMAGEVLDSMGIGMKIFMHEKTNEFDGEPTSGIIFSDDLEVLNFINNYLLEMDTGMETYGPVPNDLGIGCKTAAWKHRLVIFYGQRLK